MLIGFNKTKDPYGWLGNMSAHPIEYRGKLWKTSEALFQSLRFNDEEIIEAIRAEKSPMGAKMLAKKNRDKTVIKPLSGEDIENMRLCIKLKFEQHPDIAKKLKVSSAHELYEDVSSRINKGSALFWGAYAQDNQLFGENTLGKLLMELRNQL